MKIYADNAATSKISDKALKILIDTYENAFANPSSPHSQGQIAAKILKDSRDSIKRSLHAQDNCNIIFTSGGSESDNQAIETLKDYGIRNNKYHIISTAFEHHAVLNSLKRLENLGFEIELIKPGADGLIKTDDIKNAIKSNTAGISVMYANNEIGTIQPIAQIAKIAHSVNALFHTDAVQAAGHIDIDVSKEDIDLLSISAHKFHGPKGIGVLYVKKGVTPYKLIEGGEQETNFRAGTQNVPAAAAMACALEESIENLSITKSKLTNLRDYVINELLTIDDLIINGDTKNRLPSNINFSVKNINSQSFRYLCQSYGICLSSGSACTSNKKEASHVLLAIGLKDEYINSTFRVSFDESFDKYQADYLIAKIKQVIHDLREKPLF